jgi:hypothetical protein
MLYDSDRGDLKAAGPATDDCEGVFATLASAAEPDMHTGAAHCGTGSLRKYETLHITGLGFLIKLRQTFEGDYSDTILMRRAYVSLWSFGIAAVDCACGLC